MSILLTGGMGYIGSHTAVEFLNSGYDVVLLDNLSNSTIKILDNVEKITKKRIKFYKYDLLNKFDIDKVFYENNIEAVIHFAGLKAVGESVKIPIEYYKNNITGTLNLCEIMKKYNVKKLVFSSSATVYSIDNMSPLTEEMKLGATNPYGMTKLMIEQILNDLFVSDNSWRISILRYFNPIGAHESGLIGENPNGIPNNLMPYITQVAIGKLDRLSIFGDDYETHDGTGVRDYIHVVDLAKGHLKAFEHIINTSSGIEVYNLGTGNGYSVLDLVKTFEKVTKKEIPYIITERRKGDLAICFANPNKAFKNLGWKAEKNIYDMCRDSWRFELNNFGK